MRRALPYLVIIALLFLACQANAQTPKGFWHHINEGTFFAILDACDEDIFKTEFEYPFLLLLDDEAKHFYKALSSLQQRKRYLQLFWDQADPNPITPENEPLNDFIARYRYVKQNFPYIRPPYYDDRGKYYLKYGPPGQRHIDNGGIRTVSLFLDNDIYRFFAAAYNGFPPNKRFFVRANETWVYNEIGADVLIHFVREGSHFREVRSLTKALDSRLSKNTTWYWAELIKERRALSPELSFLAGDIELFEDRFRIAAAFRRLELRGMPHGRLAGFRSKREMAEAVTIRALPPAYMDSVTIRSRLRFSSDVSQFRDDDGTSRLKMALFVPIADDFFQDIRSSLDTLRLGFKVLLRDHLFNPHSEAAKERSFPFSEARQKGLDNLTETLEIFSQPGEAELTVQIEETTSHAIGYAKKPIRIRDFRGSQPMISDILLLCDVPDSAWSQAWPFEEHQGRRLVPYHARSIRHDTPVFCYFEIYNLAKSAVDGEIEISCTIGAEQEEKSFLSKLTSLFARSDRSSISLSYSKIVAEDVSKELIALDVQNLKEGEYNLEIAVRSKKERETIARTSKIITIVKL